MTENMTSVQATSVDRRIAELQDELADARERIRALEAATPQARRPEYERDVAMADLADAGYLDDPCDDAGAVPYCRTCGGQVGIFQGHGPWFRHYRGAGTTEDPVEFCDPGHEPVVTWCLDGAR
jgi:hypothetical protein